MKSASIITLAFLLVASLPAHAGRGEAHTKQDADDVFNRCMAQYPGGWQSEQAWSDRCVQIAYPSAAARRARRDYYRRNEAKTRQERRRCIDNPEIIDTSRCIRDAERRGAAE